MTPRTQTAFVGHNAVEQTILQSWKQRRLHHGLIFVGPKGVGKATCAFRLARFLFSNVSIDSQPDSLDIPESSPVFARVASGGHGDLLVVEPNPELVSGEISIDRVRPIVKFLSQTAMEGGWRVVIVDGYMNRNAANAILKSLEEPPKNSLLILIAETIGHLSPTIRSRCIRYQFAPLGEAETRSVVQKLCPDLADEQLRGLIPLSGGRPGYIMDLKEGKAAQLYQSLIETILALENSPIEKAIPFCQKLAAKPKKKDKVDLCWLVGELIEVTMQRLMSSASGSLITEVYPGESNQLANLLSWRSLPEWSLVIGKISHDFNSGRIGHLDRFQVLLSAMEYIANGTRFIQYVA